MSDKTRLRASYGIARGKKGERDRRATADLLQYHVAPNLTAEAAAPIVKAARRHRQCGMPCQRIDTKTGQVVSYFATCKIPTLCPRCARRRAWTNARRDFSRSQAWLDSVPKGRIVWATVVPPESSDLRGSLESMLDLTSSAWRQREGLFATCHGALVQVHITPSSPGLWRPHQHIILAVEPDTTERASEWMVHKGQFELRRALQNSAIGPLRIHAKLIRTYRSGHERLLETLQMSTPWAVLRCSKYGALYPPQAPIDRVEAFMATRCLRTRRTFGCFRNLPTEEADARFDRAHLNSTSPPPPQRMSTGK